MINKSIFFDLCYKKMQRKLVHPLILLGLAQVLLANEECDSSVGHCQGESHSTLEEENKYKEELNAMDDGAVEKENGDLEEKRDETGAAPRMDLRHFPGLEFQARTLLSKLELFKLRFTSSLERFWVGSKQILIQV